MPISVEVRAEIRNRYHLSCGYCGVSEFEIGSELEIDHFQPISHGGTNEIENLVYACTACNRFKSDYWPTDDDANDLHLLHPGVDDMSIHIAETASGRMNGLTKRGWFHIQWLKLNRPQLVILRRRRIEQVRFQEQITEIQVTNAELSNRVRQMEADLQHLLELIRRLSQ